MSDSSFYLRAAEVVGEVLDRNPPDLEDCARELCGDDSMLLEEVSELLRLHVQAPESDAFADHVIERQRGQYEDHVERAHDQVDTPLEIGRYKVIREIGRGGMGVVYECEQPSPRRRVAIKVVDALRYSKALERRLTAEAQLQGRLQHPAIAQIFDAGAADVGGARRPYFVMELIEGLPLHMHADAKELSIRGRLALVARIADGIAHAHERKIVHRDLKHENILVTESGQPKVLDFGIARFTGEATMGSMTITNEGQILGTIGYMAPEQLSGEIGSIGPPADVYALGVILYELVSGRPPHDLAGLSIGAAVRMLDQQSPVPLRAARERISRDIETVVGRCLEREPRRRYQTADELAADLRRILANRPIVARPPSKRYRAGMFVKRNKALVGGTVATVLTLVVGIIVAVALGIGQHQARLEAEQEREIARQNELDAIRGVLAGTSALTDRGDTWEAARQLYAIDAGSRGWEWRHAALRLPWIIERPESLPMSDRPIDLTATAFVSNREAMFLTTDATDATALLLDARTSGWRTIKSDQRLLAGAQVSGTPNARSAGVFSSSGAFGWLDVDTGDLSPTPMLVDAEALFPNWRAAGTTMILDEMVTGIFRDGKHIFINSRDADPLRLGDDIPDDFHAGPWWEIAAPPPGSPYLVVANWAFEDRPSELVCVDRRTGSVVATAPASHGMPAIAIDVDGSTLYTRSETGFDLFSVPALERIGSVEDIGSALNIVPDPGGGIAFVALGTDGLWFYGPDGSLAGWPETIGAQGFSHRPSFAPDGRLLIGVAPGDNLPWIIDTDSAILPQLRGVTPLEGHETWVYQVAVSPDGSLLASAAPMGDLVLWDLTTGTILHRIDRPPGNSATAHAHAMDAPLVFSDDGETLYFGGFSEELRVPGLVTLDLRTGEQSWTPAEDRSDLHRRLARILGDQPRSLHHHAAVLPGGRIIESTSARFFSQRVAVLDRDSDDEIDLHTSAAGICGGVAVSPDGSRFVACSPHKVLVRDSESLDIVHELSDLIGQDIFGSAYSPDGTRLAIGTRDGRVLIYETRYYKRLAVIDVPRFDSDLWAAADPENRKYIYSFAWTPDGRRLVCAGGSIIRVLESERPVLRDDRRRAWQNELAEARAGRGASDAARRAVAIERWAGEGGESADAPAN